MNPFVKNGLPATPDHGRRVDRQLQAHDSDQVFQAGGNQYFYGPRSPGQTPGVPVNTIPRNIDAFTGRAPELRTLSVAAQRAVDSMEPVPIYAIDGMAGVGKSALAIHAAHL